MRLFGVTLLMCVSVAAQTQNLKPDLKVSGYVEPYYCYDVNDPANHTRPSFIYSYHRHHEFNLNIGYIGISVADSNYRANFALMAGTYTNANMVNEPGILKNIYEANAGVKLSRRHNLWLDMGVFASHIGFESAVGKNCWNLTRSMLADNTPYFETGIKLNYATLNEKWNLTFLVLNGWQRIQRIDGNSMPSFGTQATYKAGDRLSLNSSTFIGTDSPDSIRTMRYFHNFYATWQFNERIGLIAGFDIGFQQKAKGSSRYNSWNSSVIIARFTLTDRAFLALRGEYYEDQNGVIISTGTMNGFQTYGYSINFDYAFSEHALWRIEARGLSSKDKIFERDGRAVNDDFFLTTAIAISL